MKRERSFAVAFLCFISRLLIAVYIFKGNKYITSEDTTANAYRQDGKQINTSEETQKEKKQIDGLPETAQIPRDEDLAKLNETAFIKIYWKYINMLQILCKDVIRVGNLGDGGKKICIDPGYKPQAPCLVYSFGMKEETRRMSEHIWFYRWGLSGKNAINLNSWNMKTLDAIRSSLGHTNRTLDILKIDIGDEWNAIPQMISSGALDDVRQISMETHFAMFWGNVPLLKRLSALRQLYDFGYRTFMRERNLASPSMVQGYSNVNEISMIKPKG